MSTIQGHARTGNTGAYRPLDTRLGATGNENSANQFLAPKDSYNASSEAAWTPPNYKQMAGASKLGTAAAAGVSGAAVGGGRSSNASHPHTYGSDSEAQAAFER